MFDFNELKGLIVARGFNNERIAKAIGISSSTFSLKINGINFFTAIEIYNIIKLLEIPNEMIERYFFTTKV